MKRATLLITFTLVLVVGVLLDLAPVQVPDGIDKIYHFTGFFLLTLLSILNFIEFFGMKLINLFLLFVMTFGGIFAGISEILQKLISVRSCDVNDWFVNLLGITFVCMIVFLVCSKQKKESEITQTTFDFKDLPSL